MLTRIFVLPDILKEMGSWPSAYQELRRTAELQPDHWQAQLELGQIELAGGRRQDAKDRALTILKSAPTNSDAQILLSNADLALGNPAEALREATAAVSMAPDRPVVYLNLGQIQFRIGKPEDAESSVKKAQALTPKRCFLLTWARSTSSRNVGRTLKSNTRLAFRLPKDLLARAALANMYVAQGQPAQAEQTWPTPKNS